MDIAKVFEASGSRESVFELFQDVPSVAQCLPGAQITAGEGTGPFRGTVAVAVGPVSASFEGEANVSSEVSTFSGQIEARGTDLRGGNRGEITLQYRLEIRVRRWSGLRCIHRLRAIRKTMMSPGNRQATGRRKRVQHGRNRHRHPQNCDEAFAPDTG